MRKASASIYLGSILAVTEGPDSEPKVKEKEKEPVELLGGVIDETHRQSEENMRPPT